MFSLHQPHCQGRYISNTYYRVRGVTNFCLVNFLPSQDCQGLPDFALPVFKAEKEFVSARLHHTHRPRAQLGLQHDFPRFHVDQSGFRIIADDEDTG